MKLKRIITYTLVFGLLLCMILPMNVTADTTNQTQTTVENDSEQNLTEETPQDTEEDIQDTEPQEPEKSDEETNQEPKKATKAIAPRAMTETASDMATLQTAIDNVDDGGTITLTSGFVSTNVLLTVTHDRNFTIDGSGQTIVSANAKHLRFSKTAGTGNNTITIKDVTFDGNNANGGVSVSGKIKTTYENATFQNIKRRIIRYRRYTKPKAE